LADQQSGGGPEVSALDGCGSGILFFTLGGCLVAQALLAAAGVSQSQHFWADYLRTLRFAVPLALVFGLGAMTHASLLARVQAMEQELHEKELAEERTRKLAAETRLRSLESWIHPHFLFNTLNSISALIALDPARAEQIVGRLATLLRASLDSSDHSLIPLRQELAMVESYVDIERRGLATSCADGLMCRLSCARRGFRRCRCSLWWRMR